MPTYQRRLFSKMRSVAGNYSLLGNMALATFASQAINTTMARAYPTLFKQGSGFFRPSLQPPTTIALLINSYRNYSSSTFRSFFVFLITSTVIGGGKIVVANGFLASFFDFLDSRCL
jgi:hypothetical protein